nr:MAG TPA: hypothetical protein [Caudoviricetes sp.]
MAVFGTDCQCVAVLMCYYSSIRKGQKTTALFYLLI